MAPKSKPKVHLTRTFLREWRRTSRLSQEDAAKELQISRSLLSQIENAKSPYTQRLIENASALYQCSPAEIIGGPGILNYELLRDSVKSVEQICIRMHAANISIDEKAKMIVDFYRDSLHVIKSINTGP